jgi:hypothetical protein
MTAETQLQELFNRKAGEMQLDSHMPETVTRGAMRRQALFVGIAAAAVVPAVIALGFWIAGSQPEPATPPVRPAGEPGVESRWIESLPTGAESSQAGEFTRIGSGTTTLKARRYVYDGISPDIVIRAPGALGGGRATFVNMRLSSGGSLHIANVTGTLSPDAEFPPREPLPEDVTAYLQQHPLLESTAPEPITVGGYEGFQIDVTASTFPHSCQEAPDGGGTTECLKFLHNEVWPLAVLPGETTRAALVEVDGRLIGFTFPIGGDSKQEARRIMSSLEFLET